MTTILLALGLVLIVEGLAWMLAPSLLEDLLRQMRDLPVPVRRQIGALALTMGLILLWFTHHALTV